MRRSGGTRSLLSVSFRRPSCSSSRPRLVCVSLCVCASAKGKEKREESVAYHRQRAALDRLQEKHNLASLERERRRNEGAFTRRADRECACPRGKETRRARLKLECPLECCWVVCTGWFSNRSRIERIKPRGNERDEEFNGRPRDIRYTFFRLIDHCTYFEFHLPQNFSIITLSRFFSIISHLTMGLLFLASNPFLAFPSRNLFQIECVARSSTNRNDAWPQKRLLFTRLTPLVQVDEVESARMQLYIYVRAVYFKRSALSLILLNGIYLRSKQIARS